MVIRSLSVAMACLLVGTGCSAEDPQPPPVPKIESPKRLVGTDPCVLLDEATLARHGLGQGVPGQDILGASCRWGGPKSLSVQLTAYTSGTGLADLAKTGDSAAARVRLSGYPALETFTTGGQFCRYDIGVAEAEALVATMDGGEPDSCSALQELLSAVISRLPASG